MKDFFSGEAPVARAHARHTDPRTSHEAAARVTQKLTALQEQVLLLFRVHLELTDLDLEHLVGSSRSTYRTRRGELVKMGLLYDTGREKHQEGSSRAIWGLVR